MNFIRYWFEQFCLNTHLHGYKFIALPERSRLERLLWTGIITTFLVSTLTILIYSRDRTTQKSMIFVTDSINYPIWHYPFPAVTICSFNKISKRQAFIQAELIRNKLDLNVEEIADLFSLLGQLYFNSENIEKTNTEKYLQLLQLLDHNKIDINRLLRSVSPPCNSVLTRCRWKGENKNCDMIFEKIITSEGHCCSFNYYAPKSHTFGGKVYPARSPPNPRRVSGCGHTSSLEVLIDNDPHDYHSSDTLGFGHKIILHSSFDYPDWGHQSLLLGMKVITFLGVNPSITHSTDDLRSLRVGERGCYFKDEFPLLNFRYYTYQNCLTECRMNLSRNYCGCIPVIYTNEDVDNPGNYKICSVRDIECLNQYRPYIRSSVPGIEIEAENTTDIIIDLHHLPCGCLPECSSPSYNFQKSSSFLETKYTPWAKQHGLFNGVDINNHSVLKVFFNDLVGTRYRRSVTSNWQTFLAFYGGILGLFLGFSFISGIELIYFFTVKLAIDFRKKIKIVNNREKKATKHFSQENKSLRQRYIGNSQDLRFNARYKGYDIVPDRKTQR